MADGFTIGVTGLAELEKTLTELSTKQADAAVRKSLKAGAEIEQAAIVERAPVKVGDGGILPDGALKSDIVIKMKRISDGSQVAVVGPDEYTRRVAGWVEFGHRMVTGGYSNHDKATGKTRGPGQQIGDVEEHPFIRPAFEATREEVAEAMSTVLAEEITKAAAKK